MNIISKAQKIVDVMIFITTGFAFLCVFAMMLQIVGDVFGRYVLLAPIQGTMAIVSDWYMVAAIFLPLAHVQRHKMHIAATFFTDRGSVRKKLIFEIVGCVVMLIIFLFFGWYTLQKAFLGFSVKESVEETFRIPIWPVHFFLPIGSWVLCLQLIIDIIDNTININRTNKKNERLK
jgi:TRAP-type C4-dicarboxylate transport system permease small subunit